MSYITAGLGVTVVLLGLALGIAGKAYLGQRDENVRLAHTAAIARLTQEHKEAMETALAVLSVRYDTKIAEAETTHTEEVNGIMLRLASAQQDASQKPMAFGDDLIRDIIRVDCLWALGASGASPEGRQACRDEAASADPAKSGLPFAIVTPDWRDNWVEACSDWGNVQRGTVDVVYSEEDWEEDWPDFDVTLCDETLVAMTPEGSYLLRNFVNNGQHYSERLLVHAVEQSRIIDLLSQ